MSIRTQEKKSTKIIFIALLALSFIYSIVLSYSWGNNPFDEKGTLSLLCDQSHRLFFWLWIILDSAALYLNINYMYKRFGHANKLIKALPIVAVIFNIGIAASLGGGGEDWCALRIIHWASTIGYILSLVASVALYALINFKKDKIFKIILGGIGALFVVFVLWFIILGKSGMFEIVPLSVLKIILLVVNFIL